MPIKDIVTKYVTHALKNKKIKNDAFDYEPHHREGDSGSGHIQKKKEVSGKVEAEYFKVTTMDLGVLTRDIGNHIFKFSIDHMLT